MRHLDVTRLDILSVERAELPPETPSGLWPCSACGRGYDVHDGWLIDYYLAPRRMAARAYVCARCAELARRAAEAGSELDDTG